MRYFMLGPGSKDFRSAAFLPGLALTPMASSHGSVRVTGQPGTASVSAPKPAALVPISQKRETQRSNVSPDVIFPSIYVAHADNMHPPVSLFRDNQMPVPALDMYQFPRNPSYGAPFAGRNVKPSMRSRRVGTRKAVRWPASPQVFT